MRLALMNNQQRRRFLAGAKKEPARAKLRGERRKARRNG